MKILYLTSSGDYRANTVYEYDAAFSRYSRHDIRYLDILADDPTLPLEGFDALLFSYTFWAYTKNFTAAFIKKVAEFRGGKVALLQDEYLYYLKHRDNFRALGINAIVTLVPERYHLDVFGRDCGRLPHLHALAGYVPENLERAYADRLPLEARQWSIGYRGRVYRPIFGKLAREKYEIGVAMRRICRERGISADIEVAEDKRIYGEAWPQFIRQCRVLLGTESGSNVFDFDGSMAQALETYQADHPDADFDELHAHCIGDADGIIRMNQISPKFFETIALGTGHMLFEGEYSGILKPWKHYIPLKKDYSNLDEALAAADDLSLLDAMIRRSYEDIVLSGIYSYRTFIGHIDRFVESLPRAASQPLSLPSSGLLRSLPPPRLYRKLLQEREDAGIRAKAERLRGKNLIFYGAGEAYAAYARYFRETAAVRGIFLDREFHREGISHYDGLPILGEEELTALADEISAIVIFCRMNYKIHMLDRIRRLFPDMPPPVTCTLFFQTHEER